MRRTNVVSRDQERGKSMNAPLEKTSARREVKDSLQRIKTGVEGEGQAKERERFQWSYAVMKKEEILMGEAPKIKKNLLNWH